MNILAELNAEYVKVIQAAKEIYEKTGKMTVFRRRETGKTEYLTIEHAITVRKYGERADTPENVRVVQMILSRKYNDFEAVAALHRGGWECLKM